MPATPSLPYVNPSLKSKAGQGVPTPRGFYKAPLARFKQYDFLQLLTTGTILTPAPTGALATAAGPLASQIVVTQVANAAAPGGEYYYILTYTATGTESQASAEYLVLSSPGFVPAFDVIAAGAPVGATNFAAYISYAVPGQEALQQATRTTTALGTAFTTPSPLTNSIGVAQAATNQAANIVGLAMNGSDALYLPQYNHGVLPGSNANILGVAGDPPPFFQTDAGQVVVAKTDLNQTFLIALVQPYYPSLNGTTGGLLLDAVSGYFVLDNTQSNKIITIVSLQQGVDTSQSTGFNIPPYGVQGMLVEAYFNSGTI